MHISIFTGDESLNELFTLFPNFSQDLSLFISEDIKTFSCLFDYSLILNLDSESLFFTSYGSE